MNHLQHNLPLVSPEQHKIIRDYLERTDELIERLAELVEQALQQQKYPTIPTA